MRTWSGGRGIAWGIYYNAGETCHAGSRLIVHQQVRAGLIDAIERVAAHHHAGTPVGPGDPDGGADRQRPSQAGAGLHRFRHRRRRARGLRRPPGASRSGGYYVEATVLDGSAAHAREPRGDLRPGTGGERFREPGRSAAGRERHDLRAGGRRLDPGHESRPPPVSALRAGTVWINSFDRSSLATPFGGFKQSGFGRDRSPHAIDKYVDLKTIWTAFN